MKFLTLVVPLAAIGLVRGDMENEGKYQNCHLVLKGSFWFFLVLLLVLFSSAFGSLVLFQFFILVLQVLSELQRSENQSLVIPVNIL